MGGAPRRLILPPLSAAGPDSLYQQIVDGLKREVSEGRLRAGTALPSFRALAEDLLVSVITVKRAYEELEREGIIYRRQGLGTFVAHAAVDRSRDAKIERARELMRDAAREAAEAGLATRDIFRLFESTLDEKREPKHVRKRG
jgi:GntR family transcriptional regulator